MTHPVIDQMIGHFSARIAAEVGEEGEIPASRFRYDWELDWEAWLQKMFPLLFSIGFAPHHAEFWAWVWALRLGIAPDEPFVGIWSRGGGKSSSAEGLAVACGVRDVRRYALYMRSTQEQADSSVSNIGTMLESPEVERFYPQHADRMVGKYGTSKGWRRNRLRTAGGFTVDALGLDVAVRGVKMDAQRPDLIIFDDLDELHDSPHMTKKKIKTLTKSVLPAGSPDCAVVGIQNLIIPNGIFSQLSDGRAQFLMKRRVSGPHPAIKGLKTKVKKRDGKQLPTIVAGEAVWEGQSIAACQKLMDDIGLPAFLEECQHQVHEREGALWTKDLFKRVEELPPLKRAAVAADPSGGSAEIGIIGAGVGYDDIGYVFCDETQPGDLGPLNWGNTLVDVYDEWELDKILAERNFGGDMVEGNVKAAAGMRRIPFELVTASRGKTLRAEPVASLYEDGLVYHVGTFPELEIELTSWVQGDPWSPNRLDALVIVLSFLMLGKRSVGLRWGSQGRGVAGNGKRKRKRKNGKRKRKKSTRRVNV